MLIDSFTFFNETEMLLFRLQLLSPMVDKFVLVDSDYTFSGKLKPYYSGLLEFDSRFSEFKDKIVIYNHRADIRGLNFLNKPTEFDQSADCWSIENQQRGAIGDILGEYPSDALVIMGDVDEIPSREALQYALNNTLGKDFPVVFGQFMFYYDLKFLRNAAITGEKEMRCDMWKGSIITNVSDLIKTGAQSLRDQRELLSHCITQGGWHLSYFGDVATKVDSFSHQEFNKDEFKTDAHIKQCKTTGQDLFNRPTHIVPMAKEFFPKYFQENVPDAWWGL